MSIQMSLVFGALILEMVTLLLMVLPLPHPVRVKIMDIATVLRNLKNFKIGFWFTVILLSMQFADCIQRLQRFGTLGNPYFALNSQNKQFGTMLVRPIGVQILLAKEFIHNWCCVVFNACDLYREYHFEEIGL